MASPHPRGWTQHDGIKVIRTEGFPAPAGMDR